MLNALYGTGLTLPASIANSADPANVASKDPGALLGVNPLDVVNDAADLLVGDAVRALVPALTGRSLLWADDIGGVLPGAFLNAYAGAFPRGYATLEWNATVMAAAGDIPTEQLKSIRNGNGLLGAFLVIVDGAIPTVDDDYCWVFDNIT
jgi:hypothetical protein